MDRRLFPLSVEHFRREIESLIAGHHKRPGWPPGTGHYLSISLICQSLMSCGLGEIGTQSSMLLQIKDITALPSRDLIKNRGKYSLSPEGGHLSRRVRSRAL